MVRLSKLNGYILIYNLNYFFYFYKMEARILEKDENSILIGWSDPELGFGQLSMEWDDRIGAYHLDSENMGIDTVIRIFKQL